MTNFDFGGSWNVHDRSKETFSCVEYALNGKCGAIVGRIWSGDGFEFLRKLARKYDPISPQPVSIYKARVLAFAGQPCMNFSKTVERLHELEKLRGEMRENTGEDIKGEILTEVFFPTMDASCQSEVIALRVKIGRGCKERRPS